MAVVAANAARQEAHYRAIKDYAKWSIGQFAYDGNLPRAIVGLRRGRRRIEPNHWDVLRPRHLVGPFLARLITAGGLRLPDDPASSGLKDKLDAARARIERD